MAKGLYSNAELVDTIIVDLNNLTKELASGQYIQYCSLISRMGQKLANLRKSIDADLRHKDEMIETLKDELRVAGREVVDMTPAEFFKQSNGGDGNGK